jgi:hypothetical protein
MRRFLLPIFLGITILVAPLDASAQQQQPIDLSVFSLDVGRFPLEPCEAFSVMFDVFAISFPVSSAHNVRLRVELPAQAVFAGVDQGQFQCTRSGSTLDCSLGTLDPATSAGVAVNLRAPDSLEGAAMTIRATVSADELDPDLTNNSASAIRRSFREYEVTSTSDSGDGSLRSALERSGAECDRDGVPCRIVFHIPPPVPDLGWFTITPRSPLPPTAATYLILDATTQTAFTGDTNSAGPVVHLNGLLLEHGNGLEVGRPQAQLSDLRWTVQVSGFVISGFPENGLLFRHRGDSDSANFYLNANFFYVTNNYIGTDPGGAVAMPNGLRGIAVFEDNHMTISSNVISGNGRSGVLVDANGVSIENNRIGVQARTDGPLPNGASGIYFGTSSGSGCVIGNVIANNSHFGVALERLASNVWVTQNSIRGNEIFGLDIGLDLSTVGGTDNVVIRPTITSARYDVKTNTTTIRGTHTSEAGGQRDLIDIYANHSLEAKGEGEAWIGSVFTETPEFVLEYAGNLLGKAVTAIYTRTIYDGFLRSPSPKASSRALSGMAAPAYPCESQGFEEQSSEFSDPVLVTE